MSQDSSLLDCVIIGGGAAGLTAATYLARFRRRFELIDGASSRLLSIPTSHNYPGYAGGIHGRDLLARLGAQVTEYGVSAKTGTVDRLEKLPDGSFIVGCGDQSLHARTVILATGVNDVEPALPDVKRAVAQGCIRYCPICDGYESIGKKVAVISRGKNGLGEAVFVKNYASDVSLLSLEDALTLTDDDYARVDAARIRAVHEPVVKLTFDPDGAMDVHFRGGTHERFDVVYAALGTLVNSGMALTLGAASDDNGALMVDDHQQTTVDGLYAAGDIVAGLNQIVVAMGQAAVAATAIHNRLREAH